MSTSRWGCVTAVVLLIYFLLRSPVSEAPPAVTGIYRKYGGGSRRSNGSEFLVKIRDARRITEDANRCKLWDSAAPTPVDATTLRGIKANWHPYVNLSSWTTELPCQEWIGIVCDNFTHNVVGMFLPGQNIGGSLLAELGELTALTHLDLSNNLFSGELPQTLSALSLNFVNFSHNSLTGLLPPSLGASTSFSAIDLSYNSLSGPLVVFANSHGSTIISTLNLSHNKLNGSITKDLSAYDAADIDLSSNAFTSLSPRFGMASLHSLNLSGNVLQGSIPNSFAVMQSIQTIDMSATGLSGVIPASFTSLSSLTYLDLRGNGLSGGIPLNMTSPKLAYIDLSDNFLSGPLPQNFVNFSLHYLNVSHNQLSGPPLPSIPAPSPLSPITIDLSHNYFTHSPPSSLSAPPPPCPLLGTLDLSANCFSPSPCNEGQQLSAATCSSFCGTTSSVGPCSGKGVCFLNASVPTCSCETSYVIGSSPSVCVYVGPPPTMPPPSIPQPPSTSSPSSGISVVALVVVVGGGVLVLTLVIILLCVLRARRGGNVGRGKRGEPFFFVPGKVNVIPLYVLEEATDNFAEDRCIGEGGYGKVYKAEGVDGTLWAVKRSKLISDNGLMDFVLEVQPTP